MSDKIHPTTGLPENQIVHVPFTSEEIRVNAELIDVAVKQLGLKAAEAATRIVGLFDAAIVRRKNELASRPTASVAGDPRNPDAQ